MNAILRYSFAALAFAGLMSGQAALAAKPAPTHAGVFIVEDGANLFSRDAVKKAKDEFAEVKSTHERQVHIVTMAKLPAEEAERYEKVKSDKDDARKFWRAFAVKEAKDERAKGVFVVIVQDPGHLELIADKAIRNAGFSDTKENKVRSVLLNSLKASKESKQEAEARTIRDKGLMDAAKELHDLVPVSTEAGAAHAAANTPNPQHKDKGEGTNIGSWICIGLCVLLGLWLIVGLFRAFTGGGGGGGGSGGGPGYGGGGGGGGGGFMTGLLGGLFGSMAGMWMYNHLLGGATPSAFGGDNYTGDTGTSPEAGTGDFSDDQGGGGDYGDGSGGDTGGDWSGGGGGGGGGGDWGGGGGGGDWGGGGGGDFGGGGGDF